MHQGTLALVTSGGTAGLGRETVRVLTAAGADVVLTARSADAGQRVAQELVASGVKVGSAILSEQLDTSELCAPQCTHDPHES